MDELQKLIARHKIDEKKLKLSMERITLINVQKRIDDMQGDVWYDEKVLADKIQATNQVKSL